MPRFLTLLAACLACAASATAQTATIPTFGATEAPADPAQIPTFGSGADTGTQPAIPSFGSSAAAPAQGGGIPAFGAAQPAAQAAVTGNINANDPQRIMAMLQEAGFQTSIGTDSLGDPMISAQVSRTSFNVFFYGCTDGLACTTLQFAAGYDLANGTTAQVVNDWNANKRFAFTYLDVDNDPFLQMDLNLDFDGVGPENLRDNFALWREQVEAFEAHIDW